MFFDIWLMFFHAKWADFILLALWLLVRVSYRAHLNPFPGVVNRYKKVRVCRQMEKFVVTWTNLKTALMSVTLSTMT